MSREPNSDRLWEAQIDLILSTQPDVSVYPPDWRQRRFHNFLYRRNELLVEDDDLERVLDRVDGNPRESVYGVSRVVGDFDSAEILAKLESEFGAGVATTNDVLTVCPSGISLAAEPLVPSLMSPWPPVAAGGGKEVKVLVLDTGFLAEGFSKPWLNGVVVDPEDIESPDSWPQPDGFIDPYAGHGTFVAGIVRCLAPEADVVVKQVIEPAGVVDEFALVRQLEESLTAAPDVVVLALGGTSRGNLPPRAFTEFYERSLRHRKGVQIVAAAGNGADRAPFWPAAFPWVVSVGSLASDSLSRSPFTNYGGWVDVYALGEGLTNAFAAGSYRSIADPTDIRTFDGMCDWSGTSFSTAIVAGAIARRMTRAGENAQQAAAFVTQAARDSAIEGVGPRVHV